MTNTKLQMARQTATELLRDMELEEMDSYRILMRALRIARLLEHDWAERWLGHELSGYPTSMTQGDHGKAYQYFSKSGRELGDGKYRSASLLTLEAELSANKAALEGAAPRPMSAPIENFLAAKATQQVTDSQWKEYHLIKSAYVLNSGLVPSILVAVHTYVSDTLRGLMFGDVAESMFDDLRGVVDDFVSRRAPRAAEKLDAIAERMADGRPEACAGALTSCRRLMLALADDLFPARDEPFVGADKKSRQVGADQYKNRLIAFIDQSMQSGSTLRMLEAELEHLCARLDAAYGTTNKGVHADVTLAETRLTIVQAYVFIGELARIASYLPRTVGER